MTPGRFLLLHPPRVVGGRRVQVAFSHSQDLGRYFCMSVIETIYDTDVREVSSALLVIPALGTLAPICWAAGAELRIPCVDAAFFEALHRVAAKLAEFYPQLSWSVRMRAERVSPNEIPGNGVGLLFSGGVDSLASFVLHHAERPHLVMVHGADLELWRERLWTRAVHSARRFANSAAVPLHTVRSTFRQALQYGTLNADFARHLLRRSWWAYVQHGLALLSLLAPLSARHGLTRILIASSLARTERLPSGSHAELDSLVAWGNVRVAHDGDVFSRYEKIRRLIRPYFEQAPIKPTLRVCLSDPPAPWLNCGRCEKCARTMVALLLEGMDPRACGLPYGPRTLPRIRQRFLRGEFHLTPALLIHWRELQRSVDPPKPTWGPPERAFFAWLREADLDALLARARAHQDSSTRTGWGGSIRRAVRRAYLAARELPYVLRPGRP